MRPLQRLPPSPPPRFVPTATHVEQRPPPPNPTQPKPQELLPNGSHRERLLQQFEVVRQPQPQLLGYGGGEFGDIASSLLPSPQPQQVLVPMICDPSVSDEQALREGELQMLQVVRPVLLDDVDDDDDVVFVPYDSHLERTGIRQHDLPVTSPSWAYRPMAPIGSERKGSAVPYDSSKSVAQSSSTPSSSVAPGPSARFDPYASSFLTALRTNRSDSRKPAFGPLQWLEESNARPFYTKLKPGNVRAGPSDLSAGARPFLPLQDRQHLEEVREYLLRAPMDPSFATSFESKYVVLLLEEGDKRVRESVCKGVKRAIHRIMKSKEGQAVFIALLQACKDSVDALQGMIKVSCNGKGYLMEAASNHYGENALKELVNVVAPHEELCGLIDDSLLAEGVMQHPAGPGLIHHCFSAIPYRFCKAVIQYSIDIIDGVMSSDAGCKCLEVCLKNARDGKLADIEEVIWRRTGQMATGTYSCNFLKRAIESGSNCFIEHVAEQLLQDITGFTLHPHARFVVMACFIHKGSHALRERLIAVFLSLRDDQLAKLVQHDCISVIQELLLKAGNDELSERIQKLDKAKP